MKIYSFVPSPKWEMINCVDCMLEQLNIVSNTGTCVSVKTIKYNFQETYVLKTEKCSFLFEGIFC